MKAASPLARIAAFWTDALIQVSALAAGFRLVWTLMPGSEVRESAMQLFTEKDFRVFWANAAFALLFLYLYAGREVKPGQRLLGIRLARIDGAPMTPADYRRVRRWSMLKAVIVLLGGPLSAFFGGNLALSLLALFAPLIGLIALSAQAWADPEGVGPQERSLGVRYVASE